MNVLKNFELSIAKRELSPFIKQISGRKGAVNRAVQNVIPEIDKILLETEGRTAKEFLSKRRYEALEGILSFLVREGYSQVKQEVISEKFGISKPLINETLKLLEDLEVCQQLKNRVDGRKGRSVYVLTLHDNYLKIVEYFRNRWCYALEVVSVFTEKLTEKFTKKFTKEEAQTPCESRDEEPKTAPNGLNVFNVTNSLKQEEINKEAAPVDSEIFEEEKPNRKQDKETYLTDDQKRSYYRILSEVANVTEEEAYKIALRMPKNMTRAEHTVFVNCINWFKGNKADTNTVACFEAMFKDQCKVYEQEEEKKTVRESKYTGKIPFYNWIEENIFVPFTSIKAVSNTVASPAAASDLEEERKRLEEELKQYKK